MACTIAIWINSPVGRITLSAEEEIKRRGREVRREKTKANEVAPSAFLISAIFAISAFKTLFDSTDQYVDVALQNAQVECDVGALKP